MKTPLTILLFFLGLISFSQNKNLSLEVSYPLTVDKNFLGENYRGTIDFGAAYRFIDFEKVKLGVSVNAGFYSDNDNEDTGFDKVDVSIFAFQPRAFAELYLEEDSKFRPRLGLGYTSLRFKLNELPSNFDGQLEDSDTRGGLNINLGVGFYFSPKVFALLQYDFIKLSNDSGFPDSTFSQNVNLLKIGVGFAF